MAIGRAHPSRLTLRMLSGLALLVTLCVVSVSAPAAATPPSSDRGAELTATSYNPFAGFARRDKPVAPALSAASLINFQELPIDTAVYDQYRDRGVVFGAPNGTAPPFITTDGANPTSPVLSGSPRFKSNISGNFVVPGRNSATVASKVSLDVGYIDSPNSVQVLFYSLSGIEVILASRMGINRITSSLDNVTAFEVYQRFDEPAGFAIDNLSFEVDGDPVTGLAGGVPTAEESYGAGNPAVPNQMCGIRFVADPVNLLTGNFTEEFRDSEVFGTGPDMSMSRTYNSLAVAETGLFGRGWSSSWEAQLQVDGDEATVRFGNGSRVHLSQTPLGWIAAPRVAVRMSINGKGVATVVVDEVNTLTFDAQGRLARIEDLGTRFIEIARPTEQRLEVRDHAGRESVLLVQGGRAVQLIDPSGARTQYEYSGGNLVRSVGPDGQVTTYTYGSDGRIAAISLPGGGMIRNAYALDGRLVKQVDPRGGVTEISYDGDMRTVRDPDGIVTRQTYQDGLVTEALYAVGTGAEQRWRFEYDPFTGGCSKIVDPTGGITTRSFDASGNIVWEEDPEGRKFSYTFGRLRRPTSVTWPSGRVDIAEYDGSGNITRHVVDFQGLELTTTFGYDFRGDVKSMTSPAGNQTKFTSTPAGLVARVEGPTGIATTFDYDANGREVKSTLGGSGETRVSQRTYDKSGRLVRVQSASHQVVMAYDADGRIVSQQSSAGGRQRFEYNRAGDLVAQLLPGRLRTAFERDPVGRLIRRVEPTGATTRYQYDAMGRLSQETDPLSRVTAYTYDAAGQPLTMTAADGSVTRYSYDRSGLLARVAYSDETTSDVEFAYNKDSALVAMEDGTGRSTRRYDSAGRLIETIDGAGARVAYAYSPDGNLTELTYPNGKVVKRTFDAANNLTGVVDWNGKRFDFTYDRMGQIASGSYPDGLRASYRFSPIGTPERLNWTANGVEVADFTAVVGESGLVASRADSREGIAPGLTEFAYSARNQLVAVGGQRVEYDLLGNLTYRADGVRQEFDAAGQLSRASAAAPPVVEHASVKVLSTQNAALKGSNKRVSLTKLAGLVGDRLMVLVATSPASKKAVGAPSVSGGSGLVKVGTQTGASGRVDIWSGELASSGSSAVTIRTGTKSGRTAITAYVLGDAAAPAFTGKSGKGSAPRLEAVSRDGVTLLAGTALSRKRLQVQPGTRLVTQVKSKKNVAFVAQATRSPAGFKSKTPRWVAGLITVDPVRPNTRKATIASTGPMQVTHNKRGGRMSETVDGASRTFTYDAAMRLIESTQAGRTTRYAYDGSGLRSSLTVAGETGHFAYDQSGDMAMLLTDGSTSYLYGPGGMPLAEVTDDVTRPLLLDLQSSVRAILEDGIVVGSADYSVTGALTASQGRASALGYNGQYRDASTGLIWLRARYYDPVTSSFLTKDPLASVSGSPYGYASGNPVSFADPLGLFTVTCAQIVGNGFTPASALDDYGKGHSVRAALLSDWLRNEPKGPLKSYAGKHLPSAGNAARNPLWNAGKFGGRVLPVAGGVTAGVAAKMEGKSNAQAIGSGVGSTAGGVGGAAVGGFLCTTAAAATLGLGSVTCPVLVAGGGVAGGWLGDKVGGFVGGLFD